ncbi:hypothetical protein MUL_3427 [Mycobacterium ulcerans Agy99]|uniref:Uncharacterized protein n=4 Tax=Mycobacterium ulcerans group TaxID=2993898 RepID=A0A9N7LV04_9MYCO|nr:hypothetical protein MUL_3427 [Mycobacterium ulcerans Agy99]BBA89601.1 hypothetical protein MPSD_42340 [Mycobacterium pseudoshottsii JCM 15466]BDN83986.1 hypothetical protein NJB1907Z4_C42010 [Mycobacterium pseudoshottsii]
MHIAVIPVTTDTDVARNEDCSHKVRCEFRAGGCGWGRMGNPGGMSTPTEVEELIDALAYDVYDIYYGIEHDGPQYNKEQGVVAARYLARRLLRRRWRKTATRALPRCPHGTVTCFDPSPHTRCEI